MEYRERICNAEEREAIARLEGVGFHPLAARVLAARDIRTPEEARALLNPSPALLHDPFLLEDMDKAVARLREALDKREKIAVYGDYDADGVTATALMLYVLRGLGGNVTSFIPNRLTDGYGLRRDALETLRAQNVNLVVTVDTGVTAVEETREAADLGIDFIITDHHECRETLPEAVAVVNPHRPGSAYPFQGLAGVGVAFKLCTALLGDGEALLSRCGDLVAIGTIADIMPVMDENRVFITHGLRVLEKTRFPGLRALLRLSGAGDKRLRSQDVGFLIAPRINAAGRLGRAEIALSLLTTRDPDKAQSHARSLCELNTRRKQIEEDILSEALNMTDGSEAAIVPVGENWHQGVAGIVAAGLQKRYNRPVFLICLDGDEARGSARGVPGSNLVEILGDVSHLLSEYGGHEMAAGFALPRRNVADLKNALLRRCADLPTEPPPLPCEAPVNPAWFTLEGLQALEALEPFGTGFPAPTFALRDLYLTSSAPMGQGKHSRLSFDSAGGRLNAVRFGHAPAVLNSRMLYDIAFSASINRFQGSETPQLQLQDMQPSARQAELEDQLTLYRRFQKGEPVSPEERALLLPDRDEIADVWRSLDRAAGRHSPAGLVPLLRRRNGLEPFARIFIALDVLRELGLCKITSFEDGTLALERLPSRGKLSLDDSTVLTKLRTPAENQ